MRPPFPPRPLALALALVGLVALAAVPIAAVDLVAWRRAGDAAPDPIDPAKRYR